MFATKFTVFLLLLIQVMVGHAADSIGQKSDEIFASVLTTASAGDYPGTLDSVSLLDKKGKQADRFLVRLLDYYVGEGPTLALDEAITRRGRRMLILLRTVRARGLQCLDEYSQICMSTFPDGRDLRDEHVEHLAHAIKKGIVLRADD